MKKEYEPLFTPWKIGNVEIPNRIVQTSMGGTSLFGWLEPCHFDKEAAHHILGRAQDGVGLVLPGMQCVRDTMGRRWLYQNKKMFKDLAEWMPEFHKTGSKLFIQLAGGFGRSMAINDMFVKMLENKAFGAVSKPFVDIEYCCATAGETPNRWYPSIKSRMMTIEEIQEMVEAFAKTAKLCKDAGVDGVEIHAVHEGYLLDQFTIANMNYRTDQYGGSFENRFRFPVEIVQAIKRECGQDFPVALRYSVVSKTKGWLQGAQPGEEFEEFGRDMAESEKAIKYLGDMGYDMFNCNNGTYDAWYWAHPPVYMPDNCNYEDVAHIKNFTDKPVVCAGKMDIKFAAEKIKEGKIDALGIARQNLVDPDWVTKLREGREEEIKPCIRCHNACFNFAKSKHTANTQPLFDSLQLARCALTPSTMQHNKYKIVPTNKPKKVAIVGAGFGGLEAALVLKKRGHQPVVFEKSDKMFGLYNTASAMSFKDADKQLMQWYERELKKWDIDVRLNSEVKDITSLLKAYDDVIVSIGTFPKSLNIKGFDKTITFTDLLIGPKKDEYKKIVFLGGGLSSCEAAYDAVLAGKKPVVVEFLDDLIVAPGTCLANSSFLREALPFKGVPVHLRSSVTEIGDGYCMIKNFETGEEWKEECDCVVNGIGFVPNDQFASVKAKNLHRVGTCVKWGALREVIWSAWDVAMKI
ncbi:MAG: FAD-dependent oxidoreductase [Mogibacterium sp.]|nr:FAD-dependent oxidoreductase [Mogibacterium sp.]